MERVVFTKNQLEEFVRQEADRNVRGILSICDSFKTNYTLKGIIKNKIHQDSKTFLNRFAGFVVEAKNFELKEPLSK